MRKSRSFKSNKPFFLWEKAVLCRYAAKLLTLGKKGSFHLQLSAFKSWSTITHTHESDHTFSAVSTMSMMV